MFVKDSLPSSLILICFFQNIVSPGGRVYEVIPCTKRAIFETTLSSPGSLPDASLIITSVLSNFICDACSTVAPERLLDVANLELTQHVQALLTYCQSNPSAKVVVVPPLARSVPSWFNPYLPCFTTFLFNEVSKHGSTHIRYLSPFVAPAHFFEADGVHLNPEAGIQFIQFIISGVDQVFPVDSALPSTTAAAPVASFPTLTYGSSASSSSLPSSFSTPAPPINYSSVAASGISLPQMSGLPPAATSSFASEFGRISSALATISGVTSTLRTDVQTRREQDNLIFARLKEDRDHELNKNRENRFTVTGLVASGVPTDPKERREFYKHQLQMLVNEACPDVLPPPEVLDVYVNMRFGQSSPFLEGRMDSATSSAAFRVSGSKLARDESPNFRGLFIANAVTLSTRVRIEILRAIAKVLASDHMDAFVQGFSSRPLLHYNTKEHVNYRVDGANRSYTFVEAVSRFGHLVSPSDLLPAYRRARPAFNGCLEQYFVLLKENVANDFFLPPGPNSAPLGPRASGFSSRGQRSRYQGIRGQRGGISRGRGFQHSASPAASQLPNLQSESRKRHLDVSSLEATPSKRGPVPSVSSELLQTSSQETVSVPPSELME